MQSEGLEIVVGADVSQAQAAFFKLKQSTASFVNSIKTSFDKDVVKSFNDGTLSINKMKLALETLKENQRLATDPTQIRQYNSAIKDLETGIKRASLAGADFGNSSSKGFTKAYSALRQLAFILPGVGIAGILGAVSGALFDIGEEIFKSASKSKEAASGFKILQDTLKDGDGDYQKASSLVSELRINIGLAKDGFLSKDAVLKQYNDTIGKTTGQVESLDEAEQGITKNGDAFIKFTLLKAAAQLALAQASKEALKQAQEDQKLTEDLIKATPTKATGKVSLSATTAGDGDFSESQRRILDEKKKVQSLSEKRIKGFEDIAKNFQEQAALIGQEFKFNFFGDGKDVLRHGKDVLPKDQTNEIIARAKQFVKEFGNAFVVPDLEESFFVNKAQILKRAQKLLQDVSKGDLKIKLPFQIITEADFLPEGSTLPKEELESLRTNYLDEIQKEFQDPLQIDISLTPEIAKKTDELIKQFAEFGDKGLAAFSKASVGSRNFTEVLNGLKTEQFVQLGLANAIGDAFENVFSKIEAGGNLLKTFFQGLGQALKQLISRLAATAAAAGVLTLISGGTFAGAKGFGSIFGKLLGFADGGVVSSPTLAMIGEGAGTRNSNPEIVAPLNKLKDILGNTGQQLTGRVEFVQHGRELRGTLDAEAKTSGRSF